MGAAALSHSVNHPEKDYPQSRYETSATLADQDWVRLAVGGTLLTGAILLLTGKRRAGLVATAAATALTLLDEQETVREWWNALPRYLDDAQRLLNQAQHTVDDLVEKRDKLRAMFNR